MAKKASPSAGYSGKPLAAKLGIVVGSRLLVVAEPPEFQAALGELPADVERTSSLRGAKPCDVAVFFVRSRTDLEARFAGVAARMTEAGGVWVAWPKKASKVATDITEDVVRAVVLPTGWVDNKVCAIDDRWSGLRCVLRKELRTGARSAKTKADKSALARKVPRA